MLSSKFLPISSHAAANALRWAFFHAARVPSPSAAAQSAVTSSNGTTSTFVVRGMQRGCKAVPAPHPRPPTTGAPARGRALAAYGRGWALPSRWARWSERSSSSHHLWYHKCPSSKAAVPAFEKIFVLGGVPFIKAGSSAASQ